MNKKIIIGVVIAGVVVIAGGLYLNNKNKKAKQKAIDEEKKNQVVTKTNNDITESDAIEVIDLIDKKDGKPSSIEYVKTFIPLYLSNIDKQTHEKIKSIMMKNESDWTTQDKLTSLILIDKVVKPSKVAIGQSGKKVGTSSNVAIGQSIR
jgi:hypothetical protein